MNTTPLPTPSRARRTLTLAAVVAGACASPCASAQADADNAAAATRDDADASRLALGLGVASRQLAYAGVDRKNSVVPLVFWDSRWLRVAGNGAELKLASKAFAPTQQASLGLRLAYDRDGYGASDSPALTGMETRKGGFWGGAIVTWRNPVVQLSTEWLADLADHSKGQKLLLQAEHRFAWNSFGLTPKVQAQWLDKKVVDYYFGVRAQEALPDRPAYAGAAAMTLGAGLRLDYAVSARHAVFLDAGVTRLPDEIRNSPIVDRSTTSQVAAGYLYRF